MFLCSREISKDRVVYMLLAVILSARTLQWWLEFSYSDVGYMWEVVGDRKRRSRIRASHAWGYYLCKFLIGFNFTIFPK